MQIFFIFLVIFGKKREGRSVRCLYCPSLTQKTNIMDRKQIIKIIVSVLIAALTALGAAIGLNSCNVVRTITNKSEYYQRGDTSVMIQTKTTESYDASRKL